MAFARAAFVRCVGRLTGTNKYARLPGQQVVVRKSQAHTEVPRARQGPSQQDNYGGAHDEAAYAQFPGQKGFRESMPGIGRNFVRERSRMAF